MSNELPQVDSGENKEIQGKTMSDEARMLRF